MTANLQTGMTVKQIAKVMDISERSIYSARRLIRTNRTDLIEAVDRGNMSVNKALSIAGLKQPTSAYQRLIRAWNSCREDEKERFLVAVGWGTK